MAIERIILISEGPALEGDDKGIDEKNGVLKNRAMLGLVSKNGYTYREAAAKKAFDNGLYEGAPLYINHQDRKKSGQARDVLKLGGTWKNTHWDPETKKGRGDLHTTKKYKEHVIDIAKNHSHQAAPSHVVYGKMNKVREGGEEKVYIEHIEKCNSVDLVSNGATVSSLTESYDEIESDFSQGENVMDPELKKLLEGLEVEDLKKHRPKLYEAIRKSAKPEKDDGHKVLYEAEKEAHDAAKTKIDELEEEVKTLKETIDNAKKGAKAYSALAKALKKSYLNEDVQKSILEEYKGKVLSEEEITKVIESRTKLIEMALGRKLSEEDMEIPEGDEFSSKEDKKTGEEELTESFILASGGELPEPEGGKKKKGGK